MTNRACRTPATGRIELKVDSPAQLFHSLDPSPLAGRDLAEAVERYILESARELRSHSYELALHVRAEALPVEARPALADAIRAYFAYRSEMENRFLRRLFADGRRRLAVGLAFLFVCGLLGALAQRALPAPIGEFTYQGLLITGWVANWRPVEIFLHGWQPIRRERNLLATLAHIEVTFPALPSCGDGHAHGDATQPALAAPCPGP